MSTARDLMIVGLDRGPDRPVPQGDLSLALAGAEMIDIIRAEAATLEGDRILPGLAPASFDPLLAAAASALIRTPPFETVEDWLWRRGRGLAAAYRDALEQDGVLTRQRGHWGPLQAGRQVLADSDERRQAVDRWSSREPVLATLATAAGIGGEPAVEAPEVAGEAVTAVLASVNDAVMELEAVRQRRAIEEAAFDNVWRGFA
ncbi:GPP34 family phosphoprotein [Streptomyces sp. TS71-3]|uniref:GPP34 family phosphoprotein n=1 Tax=Streptomyces sp. TS71-3 TaxID=2733862 RepID=UPI001B25747A|nr:GPP34 family phosphoprotein [Streptomyces sp. TS71-3]GHJ38661.1 hypothetical protein Sm713_42700 [Streptomyces sp. TS71-3]